MKRLIFDTANILFRVAAAHGRYNTTGTPEEQAGLAMHMSLQSLNSYYKKFKPDQVAITFEGRDNWRKTYTASDACISKRGYKANRVKDPSMIPYFELMEAFEKLARQHTSLICLSHPLLEGDDIFAGYVQRFCAQGDTVTGVSGDKDFSQLLKYENFTLINPDTGKPRTLIDVCGVDDADYFMFEKAFRGDAGDNVMSAYPRVQKKRLAKCLNDDYELTNIMNESWTFTDPETKEETKYSVGALFEENNLLMNLEHQPPNIRKVIDETLDRGFIEMGKFNFFEFTKFCGRYGLKQIAENATSFSSMLSQTGNTRTRTETASKKKLVIEF